VPGLPRGAYEGMIMTEEKEVFHRHLKSTGNKVTSQRDAILKVFLEAAGHLTVGEIYQRARAEDPTLGFTTVYRTMKLLVECGIARSEKFDDGHLRYEYDYRQRHHDHLICTECGLVIEFYNEFIEAEQERIIRFRDDASQFEDFRCLRNLSRYEPETKGGNRWMRRAL
jgi:Fur family ferric uptake transcriptional regulator